MHASDVLKNASPVPPEESEEPLLKGATFSSSDLPRCASLGHFAIIFLQCTQALGWCGVVAVLAIFVRTAFGYSEDFSSLVANLFVCLLFTSAVVGGLLADSALGQFNTVVFSVCVTAGGYLCLMLSTVQTTADDPQYSEAAVLLSLAFVAIGSGSCLPCLSSFVGEQMDPYIKAAKSEEVQVRLSSKLSSLYQWFYLSFNVGALSGQILTPLIAQQFSYGFAFGMLLGVTLLGLLLFLLCSALYVRRPASATGLSAIFAEKSNRTAVLAIVKIFAVLPLFWTLFYNTSSLWTFSAQRMNRRLADWEMQPGQMMALNGIFDILLIPLLGQFIYSALEKCCSFYNFPRIATGMGLASLAFLAAALLEVQVSQTLVARASTNLLMPLTGSSPVDASAPTSPISVAWQVPQYFLLSAGEVMVGVTTLEMAYRIAPPRLKGFAMMLYYVARAIGCALLAAVMLVHIGPPFVTYFFFACLMMIVVVAFVAINWKNFSQPNVDENYS